MVSWGTFFEPEESSTSNDSEEQKSQSAYKYIGVTRVANGRWRGQGYVDNIQRLFADRKTEEECAEATRLKVSSLRKEGCEIRCNYGDPREHVNWVTDIWTHFLIYNSFHQYMLVIAWVVVWGFMLCVWKICSSSARCLPPADLHSFNPNVQL